MLRNTRPSFGSTPRLFLAALAVMFVLPSLSGADKWKMPKEGRPLYYKMRSTTHDRKGKTKSVVYEIDIKATDKKDERGQPMFHVRTTHEYDVPARDIKGPQLAFGAMQFGMATVAGMQWVMYQALLGQLELAVGEKLSYFGGMLAKVTAKEEVAGHEGFVVQIFRTREDKEELLAELVIDPAVPVALRARSYSKGKLQTENLMLKYAPR